MFRRLLLGLAAVVGLAVLIPVLVTHWNARQTNQLATKPAVGRRIELPPPPPPPFMPSPPGDEPDEDIGTPIPQDPERQLQRRRGILAWYQRTMGDAYERIGRKDPRWDEQARKALAAAARFQARDAETITKVEDVYAPAKAALDAGCTDPMILYVHALSSLLSNDPRFSERMRRHIDAAKAMRESPYPATQRAFALCDAASMIADWDELDREGREEAAEMYSAALALLPKSVEEGGRSPASDHEWFAIPRIVFVGLRQLGMDTVDAFDLVDATMSEIPTLKAERLKLKGYFLIRYAWEARGGGVASTVTPEGWVKFRERLAEAREALEAAWALQPDDPRTAASFITVNMGEGGSREDMERWFARAMKADGDFLEACEAKLLWLEPKWYGSPEELFKFGKACRATKNWEAKITLLYPLAVMKKIDAELQATGEKPEKPYNSRELRDKVFRTYEIYLAHFPSANRVRSEMVGFTYEAGLISQCAKQVELLGEDAAETVLFSRKFILAIQDAFRKKTEESRIAREKAEQEARKKQGGMP